MQKVFMSGFKANQPYLNIFLTLGILGFALGWGSGGWLPAMIGMVIGVVVIPLSFIAMIALWSFIQGR
ncbi:MAG: hypothetical protein HOM11_12235 [Methylococcales bacterium]|jgi:hypothetical protein|nr:hypothetical protein [Methylococcales bacterium]MBT7444593.1 hypothetical protein [Methylococcales bacterium]